MKSIARILVFSLLATNNAFAAGKLWDPKPYFRGNSADVAAYHSSSTHVEETRYMNGTVERRESRSLTDFTAEDLRQHAASRPRATSSKKHEEEVVKPKKKVVEDEKECSGCDECRPKPRFEAPPLPPHCILVTDTNDPRLVYHTYPVMDDRGERIKVKKGKKKVAVQFWIAHLPWVQCHGLLAYEQDGFRNGVWACQAKNWFLNGPTIAPRYTSEFAMTAKNWQSASRRIARGLVTSTIAFGILSQFAPGAKAVANSSSSSSARATINGTTVGAGGTTGSGVLPGTGGPILPIGGP